jgi:uncharacterized protein YqhQ
MSNNKEKHKSKIGGQALIEGVMMNGIHQSAMACRLPNGTIDVETWETNNGKSAPWYKKVPLVRGIFNFVSSMVVGYKCLMKSAEKQMTDDEEEENPEELSKLDAWLNEHLSENAMSVISVFAMIFSVFVALFLFKYIPSLVTKPLSEHTFIRTLLEGLLKITIFVAYLWVTAQMKDMKRTYEYHGAEHKTIACYEGGEELTVANVKKYTRFHPRCGTSFMIITLIISILVFCFIPKGLTTLQRILVQVVLLPLVVGISYELIKLAGRSEHPIVKLISFPGLQVQRITTREPDDSQIEVAIEAIKPCIPEDKSEDIW